MEYPTPLLSGRLRKRYKRFLADIVLDSGEAITAHCANSGSMRGLMADNARVRVSHEPDPKRKLAWSWQQVEADGAWVGIHTGLANRIAEEALLAGQITELNGFSSLKREARYGDSRLDFRLDGENGPLGYMEVKSVTLRIGACAAFPDAVTTRGQRHLEELRRARAEGLDASLLFLIQRGDCATLRAAHEIDPDYAAGLRRAQDDGVRILAYACDVTAQGVTVRGPTPLEMDPA
ncbi:DNA/RNA nuclease SfsA [Magnetofaba australis]|uniref:Sugar fermentation stimulation protein homolog n=1 Tax=Magnetofaba australis IT-1 TaxID=1434232 RepID=A0A1Y2K372_9PROT|nr:DNA/RNA nuclease SfsA [Magnetofaba australis]OSM02076.1 putative sugar fermentation stimulation protein [Magnetofaba australis IT-1]